MAKATQRKGPIITIALITAVSLLGNEMLFIVVPIYWEFFGLTSLWQVGIILSANRFIRLPINSFVGWCYERMNKRTGILIAVTLAIISTFSYGTVKGFWLLLAMRILWGIAWSFLRLGGLLTVIEYSDARSRGQLIGLYNGLWGLGGLFGMLIGGIFADWIGIKNITSIFALLALFTVPLVLLYIPNSKSEVKTGKTEHVSLLKSPRHLKIFFNGLLIAFVIYGLYSSTLSKVIEYHLDNGLMIFSVSIGVAAIAGIIQAIKMSLDPVIAPLFGKWSDQRFGRIPMLIFALVIGACCLIMIPIHMPFSMVVIVLLVFQLMGTLLITSSDSLAADLSSHSASVKTMTYYTLFSDLGAALGPLISFFVLDFIGLQWLYWMISIVLIFLSMYWYKEFLRQKKVDVTFNR